jgi:hypothetical protein
LRIGEDLISGVIHPVTNPPQSGGAPRKRDDMEFNIPFSKIVSITPTSRNRSTVELVSGEKLSLEDAQDVTESNTGILIFSGDAKEPQYVPWDELEKISFNR